MVTLISSRLSTPSFGHSPIHHPAHCAHGDRHMSIFLGTLSTEAQWDSSDGTVHTGSGEEKVPSTTGLALAGLLQTVKN